MRTERPTCRECACNKVCEYCIEENGRNLGERCVLGHWEKFFVPKQEWISVDERLPTKNEKVLVYCGGVIDTDWICSQGVWYYHEHHTITHWMPLPEAPKMKGGAE